MIVDLSSISLYARIDVFAPSHNVFPVAIHDVIGERVKMRL